MRKINYHYIAKVIMRSSIALIAILAIILAGLQFLEPTIGKKAIDKIQHTLIVPSHVNNYHLSLFKEFPRLSLVLEGVSIAGTDESEFLSAKEVSLKMNIWQLIKGDYVFKSLSLYDTDIRLTVNNKDSGNWNIFKPSSDTTNLNIVWDAVYFNNTSISYVDSVREFETVLTIGKGRLKGTINDSRIQLYPDLQTELSSLTINNTTYISDLPMGISGEFFIDTETKFYNFKDLKLHAANSEIHCTGTIINKDNGIYYDLKLDTEKGDLGSLMALLPAYLAQQMEAYSVKGKARITCLYSGVQTEQTQPTLGLTFQTDRASINEPVFTNPIYITGLEGNVSVDKSGVGTLRINKCKGNYVSEDFSGSCHIVNLSDPRISAQFSGLLPFRLFQTYIPQFTIHSGNLKINDFDVEGLHMRNGRTDFQRLKGKVIGDKINLEYGKEELNIPFISGELKEHDILIIDTSRVLLNNSDITIIGSVKNIINSLLKPSENDLAFDVALKSEYLDLQNLYSIYNAYGGSEAQGPNAIKATTAPSIFAHATGLFRADIRSFSYDKIKAARFNGNLFLRQNEFKIRGDVATCGGEISLEGILGRKQMMDFSGSFSFSDVNIKELFYQWDNFGQDFLHSDNLKGTLSGNSDIHLKWDDKGSLIYDEIDLISSLSIRDGYLKNFALLETFSDYVKVQDLRNIKVNHLKNLLIIRDGNIYIPAMFIQSSAMNLTVNGIHTFENRFDYNIKVNGGQVLMNRFRESRSELIPAQKNGWFNLYFTVTGRLPDTYTYKRDKKKVLSSFHQSIEMRERNEAILMASFPGLQSISEPKEWKNADLGESAGIESDEFIDGF